jgi:hypothetical protein
VRPRNPSSCLAAHRAAVASTFHQLTQAVLRYFSPGCGGAGAGLSPLAFRFGFDSPPLWRAGLFTDYKYAAEIASHVVLLDHHVEIEALECAAADASRRTPAPPPGKDGHTVDDGLPLIRRSTLFGATATQPGAEAEGEGDYTLNVELTLRNASGLQPDLFVVGTLINGAEQWSDCVLNSTHRRCGRLSEL